MASYSVPRPTVPVPDTTGPVAKDNLITLDYLMNSDDPTYTNRFGRVSPTAVGIQQAISDEFNATFQAQFAYKRIGNISDYVGDSLPETDKLNSYQFPDDSGDWYGPLQNQSFPIVIPADPSVDDKWALTTAATTDFVLDAFKTETQKYTDIAYKASGGNSAVENMLEDLNLNPLMYEIGTYIKTGGMTWRYEDSTGPITEKNFRAFNSVNVMDFGAMGRGVTDDTDSLRKAVTACIGDTANDDVKWEHRDGNYRNSLYIPPGQYNVTDTIEIYKAQGLIIEGGGKIQGGDRLLGMDKPVLHFNECLWFYVKDVMVTNGVTGDWAGQPNNDRVGIKLTECYIAHLENIRILGANTGIRQLQGNNVRYESISTRNCRNGFLGHQSGNNTGNSFSDCSYEYCDKGIYLDNNISYFGLVDIRGGYYEHVNECIRVNNKQDVRVVGVYAALSEAGNTFLRVTGTNTATDVNISHINIVNNTPSSADPVYLIQSDDGLPVSYGDITLGADANLNVHIVGDCVVNLDADNKEMIRDGDFYGYDGSSITSSSLPWFVQYNTPSEEYVTPTLSGYSGQNVKPINHVFQRVGCRPRTVLEFSLYSIFNSQVLIREDDGAFGGDIIKTILNTDSGINSQNKKSYYVYTGDNDSIIVQLTGSGGGFSQLSELHMIDRSTPEVLITHLNSTVV